MDRFVFIQSFISLIILHAEIFEALQADGIILNFECNMASTTCMSIKILLN